MKEEKRGGKGEYKIFRERGEEDAAALTFACKDVGGPHVLRLGLVHEGLLSLEARHDRCAVLGKGRVLDAVGGLCTRLYKIISR